MDANTSLGTGSPRRHRSLAKVPTDPEVHAGRPFPSVRRARSKLSRARTQESRPSEPEVSNLAASFPLFFFGAGCIAAAAFVLLEGSSAAIGRIPLWVPFVALGIIALAGGTLSVFAEPDQTTDTVVAAEVPQSPPFPAARNAPPDRPLRSWAPTPPSAVRAAPRAEPSMPSDTSRPRPRQADLLPAPAERDPIAPPITERSAPMPDDAASLLKEIDLIDADLHASHIPAGPAPRAARSSPQAETDVDLVAAGLTPPVRPRNDPSRSSPPRPGRLESEAPRQVARCVGCGSVILHAGAPAQCQVCGEPLCSECRDRSLAEGKPNLCPLCGLLDSVHSKGPAAAPRTRSRA